MTVAIVTGGSSAVGRRVAVALAAGGDPVALAYLDDQRDAEATVEAVLRAGGSAVAVRADVTDELDVERLFAETIAMFGGVDLVVHTTAADPALLREQAARMWQLPSHP
jgi:3-oxoacyl-[acyl-carrier protein] reductase